MTWGIITTHLKLHTLTKESTKISTLTKDLQLQIIDFEDLNKFHVIGKAKEQSKKPGYIWYVSWHTFRNINKRETAPELSIFVTTNIWPEAIWQQPRPLYQSLIIACTSMSNHPLYVYLKWPNSSALSVNTRNRES